MLLIWLVVAEWLPLNVGEFEAGSGEVYLCTVHRLSETSYVRAVEPHASQDVVHHMLLFGKYLSGRNIGDDFAPEGKGQGNVNDAAS